MALLIHAERHTEGNIQIAEYELFCLIPAFYMWVYEELIYKALNYIYEVFVMTKLVYLNISIKN